MKDTKIEWAESTWNPVTGCFHNCPYCYAKGIATRFASDGIEVERDSPMAKEITLWDLSDEYIGKVAGIGLDLKEPCRGKSGRTEPYPAGFTPTFHRYRLTQPKRWQEPRNIFVCSMADLFGAWVPEEWIKEVFAACEDAPQHNYLFLTKNPKRYGDLAKMGKLPERDNFWYGSTIDSRKSLRYPGRLSDHTFLSIEPLLENLGAGLGSFGSDSWIIIGAESGKRKDRVVPQKEWLDNICEAAAITQIPVFMKESLVPIVGEQNMRRELPKELRR